MPQISRGAMLNFFLLASTAILITGQPQNEIKESPFRRNHTDSPIPPRSEPEEIVLQVLIDPGLVECYFQPVHNPKHVAVEVDYQVISGGDLDIGFIVKNPQGVLIVSDRRSKTGSHKIEVADNNGVGDYAFCFDNSFSVQTSKSVFFELFLVDKDGNYEGSYDSMKPKEQLIQIVDFERITSKVKNNLNEAERSQAALRALEAQDRSIMEKNFERVNFWSSLLMFMFFMVFALQIVMIRSLFEENSRLGHILRKGRLRD